VSWNRGNVEGRGELYKGESEENCGVREESELTKATNE